MYEIAATLKIVQQLWPKLCCEVLARMLVKLNSALFCPMPNAWTSWLVNLTLGMCCRCRKQNLKAIFKVKNFMKKSLKH